MLKVATENICVKGSFWIDHSLHEKIGGAKPQRPAPHPANIRNASLALVESSSAAYLSGVDAISSLSLSLDQIITLTYFNSSMGLLI